LIAVVGLEHAAAVAAVADDVAHVRLARRERLDERAVDVRGLRRSAAHRLPRRAGERLVLAQEIVRPRCSSPLPAEVADGAVRRDLNLKVHAAAVKSETTKLDLDTAITARDERDGIGRPRRASVIGSAS
jgi:hypothetical protein